MKYPTLWHEYAKIALAGYMGDQLDREADADNFDGWAAAVVVSAASIADLMCAEYDKRAMGQAAAPTVSSETTERLATLRASDDR